MNGVAAAFGKMPALGDFFRIRVETAFVDTWDTWLQEIMVAGRAQLGAGWEDCYMQAPLWRFALPAGMAGAQAVVGVLMPSVDRVGRQFPLTLVTAADDEGSPFRSYFANAATLDALETLALDALGDEMTRDILDARLAGIAGNPVPPRGRPGRTRSGGLLLQDGDPVMEAADLAEAALAPGRAAIWACRMQGGSRWMTMERLPRGDEGVAMFNLFAASEPEHAA
jgi:type VI secretion system protein ImpM